MMVITGDLTTSQFLSIHNELQHNMGENKEEPLSTMEGLIYPNDLDKIVRYKYILDDQGTLNTNQELKNKGIDKDWWLYLQIQSRYKKRRRKIWFLQETRAE